MYNNICYYIYLTSFCFIFNFQFNTVRRKYMFNKASVVATNNLRSITVTLNHSIDHYIEIFNYLLNWSNVFP